MHRQRCFVVLLWTGGEAAVWGTCDSVSRRGGGGGGGGPAMVCSRRGGGVFLCRPAERGLQLRFAACIAIVVLTAALVCQSLSSLLYPSPCPFDRSYTDHRQIIDRSCEAC